MLHGLHSIISNIVPFWPMFIPCILILLMAVKDPDEPWFGLKVVALSKGLYSACLFEGLCYNEALRG